MSQQEADIVIIGAGLTGLTMAYYLQRAGKKILVLEKENRVGGVIRTHHKDGFIFESGPNTGVIGHPEVAELFEELKGKCSLEVANPKAKSRWIWKNSKWNPLPSGPLSAIGTPLFSFGDKFRILGEPFRKPGENPLESVAEMVKRRMGKSYLDYAVDPFISGIYAGDPAKLITKFALPKLYALEQTYGSFIRGAMKKKNEPKTERIKKATREVFSAKGGLNNLINALESSIGKEHFILGLDNIVVEKNENGYGIKALNNGKDYTILSKKVVSTFGGDDLPNVFSFIPKERFDPILNLEYAKVVEVTIAFKNWKGIPINAFGGLVPSAERRNILGVLFPSSFFEGRCPEGGAVLSVFLGGSKRPDIINMVEEDIRKMVFAEIREMLSVDVNEADLVKVFKYQNAIPQYGISSPERLDRISGIEKENPGLLLAGNIRDGIGMADRIKQATDIANQLIS